jgi:hypothetical protein
VERLLIVVLGPSQNRHSAIPEFRCQVPDAVLATQVLWLVQFGQLRSAPPNPTYYVRGTALAILALRYRTCRFTRIVCVYMRMSEPKVRLKWSILRSEAEVG